MTTYLHPGQAAHLLGLNDVDRLRSVENQFGLEPKWTKGGHRRYDLEDVLKVKEKRDWLFSLGKAEDQLRPVEARAK